MGKPQDFPKRFFVADLEEELGRTSWASEIWNPFLHHIFEDNDRVIIYRYGNRERRLRKIEFATVEIAVNVV